MWREFREFILRGTVVDMAVGIIIGAAFGTIVTSLVNHILMPPTEPITKECPDCLSTVPIKATRCAYGTSQLE